MRGIHQDGSSVEERGAGATKPSSHVNRMLYIVLFVGVGVMLLASYRLLSTVFDFVPGEEITSSGWLDLGEPEAEMAARSIQTATDGPSVRVAIAPVISPERSLERYRHFVDYLARRLGREPVYLAHQSYAEVNELVRFRKCDLALVCTYAFVRGEEEFGMELLAAPIVAGASEYYSYIIVPRSSSAESLLDLRGLEFASADLMSSSGWLYPAVLLQELGEDPNRFFGEHYLTGSHDRSIEAVARGQVDGAAVHSLVYDQMAADDPSIVERTKIVGKSPPYGMPPLVVHPDIDPAFREDLSRLLLDMHNDPEGLQVLSLINIDRFTLPENKRYDGVRHAARMVEGR